MITASELRTLTLWHHALVMGKTIPKMESFPDFYRSSLAGPEARLVARFEADKQKAAAELEAMFREDGH